ncbi:MAG: hypothetical protein K9M82_13240, partial [Deltaproteobacteria bacterium]|nr:hypothetical protein [Deltaproteobacteria bacterium]
ISEHWALLRFQFRKEDFLSRSRRSRGDAEAYWKYAAQGASLIDDEIGKKDPFWPKTSSVAP